MQVEFMNSSYPLNVWWCNFRKAFLTMILAPLFACYLVVYSPPSVFTESFSHIAKPVLGYAGLYYAFRPFTPDPRPYDETFRAEIEFTDGSNLSWSFPNMSLIPPSDLADHLRCMSTMWHVHLWDCYCYRMSKDQVLWNDSARYIARLHRNPANQPVAVSLVSVHIPIVVPIVSTNSPTAESPEEKTFFRYSVRPEDLE